MGDERQSKKKNSPKAQTERYTRRLEIFIQKMKADTDETLSNKEEIGTPACKSMWGVKVQELQKTTITECRHLHHQLDLYEIYKQISISLKVPMSATIMQK